MAESQERPPSYTEPMEVEEIPRDNPVAPATMIFNEALMSFTGRVAASYLSRQNTKSNHSLLGLLGSGILQLPPDLEVAKKSLVTAL